MHRGKSHLYKECPLLLFSASGLFSSQAWSSGRKISCIGRIFIFSSLILHFSLFFSIILIDGFPRRIDQAIEFEAKVAKAKGAILVDTTETEMETRLLLRSATSGRSDDNPESIKKRFQTYIKVSVPAIDYMQSSGRLKSVDGMGSKDVVSQRFRQAAWDMLHP
eukprot:TRINITY_DN8863_c0_g1_i2.p1 TRINITY_DN8863_c0_g1~~TRINITY_DN8863_c0_g1_i2.p1  ORF type:complete len:164 (-),score=24.58 TRINITY_DN8863_c0_g1_i2:332-823(-)